jgi:hypothetical protein
MAPPRSDQRHRERYTQVLGGKVADSETAPDFADRQNPFHYASVTSAAGWLRGTCVTTVWDEFGFKANPYGTSQLAPTAEGERLLVGRSREVRRLHRHWSSMTLMHRLRARTESARQA